MLGCCAVVRLCRVGEHVPRRKHLKKSKQRTHAHPLAAHTCTNSTSSMRPYESTLRRPKRWRRRSLFMFSRSDDDDLPTWKAKTELRSGKDEAAAILGLLLRQPKHLHQEQQ